jgi:hypothetical protein
MVAPLVVIVVVISGRPSLTLCLGVVFLHIDFLMIVWNDGLLPVKAQKHTCHITLLRVKEKA